VTEAATEIEVYAESIRLFRNGKPDIDNISLRNLSPRDYPVPDVDTTMKLFKKDGDAWKFVASNDDGIADSKAALISRKVWEPTTFRVVVKAKHESTRAEIGLFVGAKSAYPQEL
jgi:hypothetical protein